MWWSFSLKQFFKSACYTETIKSYFYQNSESKWLLLILVTGVEDIWIKWDFHSLAQIFSRDLWHEFATSYSCLQFGKHAHCPWLLFPTTKLSVWLCQKTKLQKSLILAHDVNKFFRKSFSEKLIIKSKKSKFQWLI